MASYTDEQKSRLMQMPAAVLIGAIVADAGSAVVGVREFMSGEKFITEAGRAYSGNTLIQDMLKNLNLPKLEETVRPIFGLGDIKAVQAECQRMISNGLAVLANDGEANQFKAFLVGLAEKVVNAAGEGFFGNRGARVSANEVAYMNQLKQQLGVATTSSM
jgi:hypothetical protein